jgi:hypothetical protein
MKSFKTLAMVGLSNGLILLRIICAFLALFYIFGTIWFLETWDQERILPMAGVISSLILCALFPITGRGSFINRIFCPLASFGLFISSLYWYKVSEELACGTNIDDGAKRLEMIVAFLYMILTLKDVIGLKGFDSDKPSSTPR